MNTFTTRLWTDIAMMDGGAMAAMIARQIDVKNAEHPGLTKAREYLKPQPIIREDGLAIVPIEGALARKPDVYEIAFYGVEDSDAVTEMVQKVAANPMVRGVLLKVDSPGGMVTGGVEIADAVRAMRERIPVVAWTGGMAASLGYYIAAQASEVVATRSAVVGSIGSLISFFDVSKLLDQMGIKAQLFHNSEATLKATPALGRPLTDEQSAYLQSRVEKAAADFHQAVRSARGQLPDEAKKGGLFSGSEAKALGLIDRVGSMQFAMAVLSSMAPRR